MAITAKHPAKDLTDKQLKFVKGVLMGLSNTAAARYAGYSHAPEAAHGLMRNQKVIDALRQRRIAAIEGDMAKTALSTIDSIMTDPSAPAQTRFNASKYILELAGHQAGMETGEKDLDEMDADELTRAITSGMQALSDLAGKLDGHHIIDGQISRYIDAGEAEVIDQDDGDDLDFLT